MTLFKDKKGIIIFGVIVVILLTVAMIAYRMTGPMGIEERFNHALGLPMNEEDHRNSWFGFSAEGNTFLYEIILVALIVACFVAYKYLKI
jgi:hypothetical protein